MIETSTVQRFTKTLIKNAIPLSPAKTTDVDFGDAFRFGMP